MKLPNFFVVGAMKSGTTSLYNYLQAHPQVYLSPVKEPNYFCKDRLARPTDRIRGKTPKWENYIRLFEGVRDEIAIGEASIVYLCSRCAAGEIRCTLPNSRILMVLRDPVQRAYSQYLNEWKFKYYHGSFREEVERSRVPSEPLGWVAPKPHIALGMYHDQVKRFLDLFGRDQVRVYLYDDLKQDARGIMGNVFDFLGVDPGFSSQSFEVRFNASIKPRFVGLDRMIVEPLTRRLLNRTTRAKLRNRLRSLYYSGDSPPMDPADREFMKEIFRDDIIKLECLIQRDLSAWLR